MNKTAHYLREQFGDSMVRGLPPSLVLPVLETMIEIVGDQLGLPGWPVDVVAAVRRREDGKIWLCQRNAEGAHGGLSGMWEYPGGAVEPGELLMTALRRELTEEFEGVEPIHIGEVLDTIQFGKYRVTFFDVTMTEPTKLYAHEMTLWMTPAEVRRVPHLPSGTMFNARHLRPRSKDGDRCSVCAGTGKPVSGRRCICGGGGTIYDELAGLRNELLEFQIAVGDWPALEPKRSPRYADVLRTKCLAEG